MGKQLNNKGVKYASDEVCKACNLIIKGDAFFCFDCKNFIHATCTRLSRETKLLYYVTNRIFSCVSCIKTKGNYEEALSWLDQLEESENRERELLNLPSRTNRPPIQPQQSPSPLSSQNLDHSTQPPDVSPSTLGERVVDQVVSFPICIGASSTPIRQMNNVANFPSPRPIGTIAQNVTATETDSEENFSDARNTLGTSIGDSTNDMNNTIVLSNSVPVINVPTSNSFSLETHSRTLNITDRNRHGIPDLDIDGLDQSMEASDTEEQVLTSPSERQQNASTEDNESVEQVSSEDSMRGMEENLIEPSINQFQRNELQNGESVQPNERYNPPTRSDESSSSENIDDSHVNAEIPNIQNQPEEEGTSPTNDLAEIEPEDPHRLVCPYYISKTCKYGKSGRHRGRCSMRHPKMCRRYIVFGENINGCRQGNSCSGYHPKVCWGYIARGTCNRAGCKFYHARRGGRRRQQPWNNNEQLEHRNRFVTRTSTTRNPSRSRSQQRTNGNRIWTNSSFRQSEQYVNQVDRPPYSALNERDFPNETRYRQREEYVNHVERPDPNEARYRQREEYVNHVERPAPYRSSNERHFSNETRYERDIRRREWRGHRGNEHYHSRDTRGYQVRERRQDERIGHRDYRENYNNVRRGIRRENFSLRRQTDARREEARQTHTGDPQHFLGRQAIELEDPQTQEVIRKLFRMVEDTRIKAGTRRHQDWSGARPVQFY